MPEVTSHDGRRERDARVVASAFDWLAATYASSLLAFVILQIALQDELFFHSDALSQAVVTLLASWVLVLPVALVAMLVARATELRAVDLPLMAVLATLALLLHDFLRPTAGWLEFAGATALALVAAGVVVSRMPGRTGARLRMRTLSRLVLVLGATGAAGLALRSVLESPQPLAETEKRHAILIVVDGLPAQLLRPYKPNAVSTGFDALAERGRVFRWARTNHTYTSGFFGTLYTGKLGPARAAAREAPSLLARLHRSGVAARWLAFHANGIPETGGVTDYPGLRSALLSERFRSVPATLGLSYHLFLRWSDTRSTMGSRIGAVYEATHGPADEEAVWAEVVPEQVAELQARNTRSLLVLHVSVTKHAVQAAADYGEDGPALQDLYARATASGYRYKPEDEPLMERIRQLYTERARRYAGRISTLLETLEQAGRLEHTLVVVTADHGSILSRNRIWYGYHPDEEVTRVPLILFGAGQSGVSDRAVDTRDLRQTLLDYLGLTDEGAGTSLLGPGDEHDVPVLTTVNDLRKERFLILYRQGRKFVLNVHPKGDARAWHAPVQGFATGERQPGLPDDEGTRAALSAAACAYGLVPELVHRDFASLVDRAACERKDKGRVASARAGR